MFSLAAPLLRTAESTSMETTGGDQQRHHHISLLATFTRVAESSSTGAREAETMRRIFLAARMAEAAITVIKGGKVIDLNGILTPAVPRLPV